MCHSINLENPVSQKFETRKIIITRKLNPSLGLVPADFQSTQISVFPVFRVLRARQSFHLLSYLIDTVMSTPNRLLD